jgi:hypothetical protein
VKLWMVEVYGWSRDFAVVRAESAEDAVRLGGALLAAMQTRPPTRPESTRLVRVERRSGTRPASSSTLPSARTDSRRSPERALV